MKKILFSIASAICSMLGFSNYHVSKSAVSYYWFITNITIPGFQPLAGTNPGRVKNINLASYYTYATTLSVSNPCSLNDPYVCLLGFTFNQVTRTSPSSPIFKLITTNGFSITGQAAKANAFSKTFY